MRTDDLQPGSSGVPSRKRAPSRYQEDPDDPQPGPSGVPPRKNKNK